MMSKLVLDVPMDSETKRKAMATLAEIGLTPSKAVRLLFHRIASDQAFPLELKVPNAETRKAMAESEEIMKRGTARFTNGDPTFAQIDFEDHGIEPIADGTLRTNSVTRNQRG